MTRETWVGLLGAGLFAALPAGQWRALRYGHGLTLRAGGIEAAESAGTLVTPWEALAAQPQVCGPVAVAVPTVRVGRLASALPRGSRVASRPASPPDTGGP